MPPAGLLAIIALGLVLAYVLPQRIRERGDYALVRTEDRYSADMRVVRATAQRLTPKATAKPSASADVPLLVTGQARATISQLASSQLATSHMSRPSGPLDRAATQAERERVHLRRDQAGTLAQRTAMARRRASMTALVALLAVVAWFVVGLTATPWWVAGIATGALATTVGASVRAGAAERKALAGIRAVAREVEAAATATRALSVVAAARARGDVAEPTDLATQAIRIVTATDLAPLAAPALRHEQRAADRAAEVAAALAKEAADADLAGNGWNPRTMPVPTYALKPSVRMPSARALADEDLAASSRAAVGAGKAEQDAERAAKVSPEKALDAILARRRSASA